jgi:hypothetical protein
VCRIGKPCRNGHLHSFSFAVDNPRVINGKFNLTQGEDKAKLVGILGKAGTKECHGVQRSDRSEDRDE